jgi:hypothetical protein
VLRAWMPFVADEVEKSSVLQYEPDPERVKRWAEVWARQWNRKLAWQGLITDYADNPQVVT